MDKDTYLKKIGDNIAKIRKDKKIKQIDLAYECDMEKSNFIRLEKGRANVTAYTLLRVAEALDVKVQSFFEGV